MDDVLESRLIEQLDKLPSLPAIAQRVIAVTESNDASIHDIAAVISEDPAIAATVLRVANSPLYGSRGHIFELRRAVSRLGVVPTRNLVLGLCAHQVLKYNPLRLPEHGTLWLHAIATAAASDRLARDARLASPEAAFVAGLLHDIGRLAMLMLEADTFRRILRQGTGIEDLLELENKHFGIDHAALSAMILARWGLPAPLCEAAERHHWPESELRHVPNPLVHVTAVADIIAALAGFGTDHCPGPVTRLTSTLVQGGLSLQQVAAALSGIVEHVKRVAGLLGEEGCATSVPRPTVRGRCRWYISDRCLKDNPICESLLSFLGCCTTRFSDPTQVERAAPRDCLMISSEEASPLSQAIFRSHNTVVLRHAPGRRRSSDPNSHVVDCEIPLLFTAHDIVWVEDQVAHEPQRSHCG